MCFYRAIADCAVGRVVLRAVDTFFVTITLNKLIIIGPIITN